MKKNDLYFKVTNAALKFHGFYTALAIIFYTFVIYELFTECDLNDGITQVTIIIMSSIFIFLIWYFIRKFIFLTRAYICIIDGLFTYFNGHKIKLSVNTDDISSVRLKKYKRTRTETDYYLLIYSGKKKVKIFYTSFQNSEIIYQALIHKIISKS